MTDTTAKPENVVQMDRERVTRYAVPAAVLARTLEVLNQLPRGQVNELATILEQIAQAGPIED